MQMRHSLACTLDLPFFFLRVCLWLATCAVGVDAGSVSFLVGSDSRSGRPKPLRNRRRSAWIKTYGRVMMGMGLAETDVREEDDEGGPD